MIQRPTAQLRDLLPILEEDTYGFWVDFSRRPGGESGSDGSAIWWRSGVPFVTYNAVAGVAADVDATLARSRGWGLTLLCHLRSGGFRWKLASRFSTLRLLTT